MIDNTNQLSFVDVSIGYRNRELIKNIQLSIPQNKLIALVGSNGSGKTSLFKTILGEEKAQKGTILLGNQPLTALDLKKHISVVYTNRFHVFGFTVLDVISLGRQFNANWRGELGSEDVKIVQEYMDLLGLQELKDCQINTLSDGQFQKVMIAKALVQETPIILMDEPTSFLDMVNKKRIHEVLKTIVQTKKRTIVVATHDEFFCKSYCSHILLIKSQELLLEDASKFDEIALT